MRDDMPGGFDMVDEKTARRGLALVFTTLLLDVIGFGIIMPVLPAFLQELTGVGVSAAAIEGGWLFFVYAAMQFLFAPLMGNLSDRFGRRPILLASVLTFAIDNLICAIAWSYSMLFIGRVLAGISGASYSTASAFIADVSNDENRAKNFGLLGIAFGVGFVIGPVLGGLLGGFGPRVPFFFAAGLAFLNFVVAYFFLPETLTKENRRKFELKRANPLGALKQMRNYKGIGWIGMVFFLMTLGHMMYPAVWSFVGSYRYGWSEQQIGFSLGVFGIGGALVMALVLPRAIPLLGEWRTAGGGPGVHDGRRLRLCRRLGGLAGLCGDRGDLPRGAGRPAAAQPRGRQGAAIGARRVARCDDQPVFDHQHHHAAALYRDLRMVHRAERPGFIRRRALCAGWGFPVAVAVGVLAQGRKAGHDRASGRDDNLIAGRLAKSGEARLAVRPAGSHHYCSMKRTPTDVGEYQHTRAVRFAASPAIARLNSGGTPVVSSKSNLAPYWDWLRTIPSKEQ